MENASKALIMAGAILVAIVIVSLSVYYFGLFSNSDLAEDWSDVEIENFNSKIEPYCGDSISGSQVNALISLVRSMDYAAQNSEGDTLFANISWTSINGDGSIIVDDTFKVTETGTKTVATGKYYKVEETRSKTNRINQITITPKP